MSAELRKTADRYRRTHTLELHPAPVKDRYLPFAENAHALPFSVKEKVAQYLIKMATEQQSRTIRLDVSRQEMADIFGIQKFSLLRCLSEFEEKGAIRIEGKTITILNSDEMK